MRKQSKINEKQSQAKRIKILLKTYEKKFKGDYQDMANFNEPVLFLMRNTRRTEFYDKATTGWFQFEHTDGTMRRIKLNPEFLQTFDYGKRTFKGYICHEDHPTPLPEKPVVTAEQFQWAIDKTQQDLLDHKAKEYSARGEMWWKILLGIGVLVVLFALAKMIVPDLFSFGGGGAKQVAETTVAVAKNVSKLP